MTALPAQWNPDTWGGPLTPAAVVPDADDLTHAAERIRRDLGQHLPDHATTALLLEHLAAVEAAGSPVRMAEGLAAWLEDVVVAARGEQE